MIRLLILPSWYPNTMKKDFAPYVRAQAQSMARNGLDVTVVYSAPYSWKWVFTEKRLIFGRRVHQEKNLHEILFFIPKTHIKPLDLVIRNFVGRMLLKKLEQDGYCPDVIHAHTYEVGRLASWFRLRTNAPLVFTEHYTGFARKIMSRWEMKVARRSFQDAQICLAVSAPFARLLMTHTGIPFRVVPNYIDTSFFSPDDKPTPINYDFLAVGHLLPKKNHQLLIKSFAHLNPKRHQLRLGVVGEGPLRSQLTELIRGLGLEGYADLLGYRDAEGVRELLKTTRIYCMPSLVETFGIAVIEAMAMGLPAVVTPSGGPETIVEQDVNGLVAEAEVVMYAKALQAALTRNWDGKDIRRRTVELYSEQTVTAQLKTIYNEAIGLRARGQQ